MDSRFFCSAAGALGQAKADDVAEALQIPVRLARVSDANWIPNSRPPDFFIIQDVHRHPQVQAQIAELIELGYDQWGIRKVFLEGAFAALDLSMFHRVPTRTRKLLVERLIRDGELSGPELAAVRILEREWRNPPVSPFQIFGMEDPVIYRKNVEAYQEVVRERGRAFEELTSIRRLQNSMELPEPNPIGEELARVDLLLRLKLTPSGYAAYRRNKAILPYTPALESAMHRAEEFYRLADDRSAVFIRESSRRVPASPAPRVIVAGGFHAAAMAAKLRAMGKTFVVLTPVVAPGEDDPLYEQRLQETATVLTRAVR